jgi:hypothetical protein
MNSMMTGLADRIASLVPSVLPAREAAAAGDCHYECVAPSSCNAGDFFVKFRLHCCCTAFGHSCGCNNAGCCG